MIITQTPLRISFAGGGTDFREFWQEHGGGAVSSTIDKYIHVILKERFDDLIVLNFSRRERVHNVDDIKHDLIRESMRKAGVEKGIEITTLADIPSEGSGLGSSSSVTVGLLHALYSYKGDLVTAEKLAREACEIELDILKRPMGVQDQYIAAYGGLRAFNFLESGKVEINRVDISPWEHLILSSRLLMFYLNRTRKSSSILEEQKHNIPNKIKTLCYMRDMSYDLYKQLKDHNLDIVGYAMNQGWLKKKSLASKVSDPKIDGLYEKALAAGALGGKVAGAGGGGFLLLYVPREKQNSVREQLGHLRELPFTLEPDGSKVIFNQRRPLWK